MSATMEKTRHPGIYKRGSRYVVVYRVNGVQRKESVATLDAARRLKRSQEADRDRGEFHADSRVPFRTYAEEWIGRYRGRGSRGFREETRDEYQRALEKYAYPFFDEKFGRTVSAISPRDVANWIDWLCREQDRPLSDASVRRILAPVRSCFATAVREGLCRHNPAMGASLPNRAIEAIDEAERVRVFNREQLAIVLANVPVEFGLFFRVLASTGLRWSEIIALRWSDVELDAVQPCVRVRRRYRRNGYGPPKSKHGRRDVPIAKTQAQALRLTRMALGRPAGDALVFPSGSGTPLDHSNTLRRILRPALKTAGVEWGGFHTFRHTCASLLFDGGANAVKVQKWLGHHSPAFTLDRYVHLLDADLGSALDLAAELQGGNKVATEAG